MGEARGEPGLANLSAERRALLARRLRAAGGAQAAVAELIALVGMACRFPGGATSPEAYWRLLERGDDVVREVPPERWDGEAIFDPDPGRPGKVSTRWGGFLDRVDEFDHDFFGISPREAARMDPQQRLLLEVAHEAIEDAGQPVEALAGSRAGVFVGAYYNDYLWLQLADPASIDAYTSSGTAHSITANRLSYILDLRGPSLTVDTACSSSLVAVHLACQSLRLGECDLALAGGVSLMLSPEIAISLSRWGALARDGRCKTFDARADGFGRGEGCGVVVLKRFADALAAGDDVLALVRGSAVNQDGRSNGLTAPNALAQAAVIRQALERGDVAPAQIGYVETHGTGTALGDPIEVEALAAVLGGPRPEGATCVLGAAKTNLGHLEAAAGVAGLIKAVLCLRHEAIPPNLHFTALNPHISLSNTPFVIPTTLLPWPRGTARRCAGVSSFGFGGTNAHVVLEEAPDVAGPPSAAPSDPAGSNGAAYLLPISARAPAALRALAGAYRDMLRDAPVGSLRDVCHGAGVRRSHYPYRLAVAGRTRQEIVARLETFLDGGPSTDGAARRAPVAGRPATVFVFSGQGAQRAGMGQALLHEAGIFRETLERCDAALRRHAAWSLLDELAADAAQSRLSRTEVAQPAIFALQAGLAALFRHFGIEPDAVVGHSVGEVAAAHVAGVLSLEEAVTLAFHRGRLMQPAADAGGMAAVDLPPDAAARAIEELDGRIAVAAINSPTSVVLSGEIAPLERTLAELRRRGVRSRRLEVRYAFHSPQMRSCGPRLAAALDGLAPRLATLPIYSTVTGAHCEGPELDAAYWGRNVCQPVLFAAATRGLLEAGYTHFLELGAHPVLAGGIAQCGGVAVASLRRGRDDGVALREALGALYMHGHNPAWKRVQPARVVPVRLPAYPWQRERHWLATPADGARRPAPDAPAPSQIDDRLYELTWRARPTQPLRPAAAADAPEQWVILADRGGVGASLAAHLQDRGHRCKLVRAGDTRLEDLPALLVGCQRLVHLSSLDLPAPGGSDDSSLAWHTVERLGCGSVLDVVRTLAADAAPAARLWLVTRGAQAVDAAPAPSAALQAPLWGLGRVIGLEHPEFWGGLVDLAPAPSGADADCLLEALLAADGEDQVAYRDGSRFVARLARHGAARGGYPPRLSAASTYLITGGRGALGLHVASWMVRHGARHLVLTGRRPVTEAEAQGDALRRLDAQGASVYLAQADVTDLDQMAALVRQIGTRWPPLAGLVHAAGVTRRKPVAGLSTEDLAAVLAPKVAGAWHLHALTQALPLDFFVLFSSAAALLGAAGQASYAAANAFLDALAHHRRARGLPALSINWGPWAGGGMAAPEDQAWLDRLGMHPLDTAPALEAMGHLLAGGASQVCVADVDWRRFKPVYGARIRRPLLDELDARDEPAVVGADAGSGPDVLAHIRQAPVGERHDRLLAYLLTEVAAVMEVAPGRIDAQRGLFAMGLDSLMAVELTRRLETVFHATLPSTLAFDYPTVEALAGYLVLRLELEPADPSPAASGPLESTLRRLHALGEDDAQAILAEKLARLRQAGSRR